MKNISFIIKRTKILKYSFLLSGVFVLFLIFSIPSNEEQKFVTEDLDTNKPTNIPKDFNLNMNNSIFEGLDKNKKPYKIVADRVTKQNNNIYNLNGIMAKHNILNSDLQILAKNGILDEATKLLVLSENVKVTFNNLILTANKINFNLNSNIVSSQHPVEVNFQNSTIKALSFSTDDSNNIINFEGNVVSTLNINDF